MEGSRTSLHISQKTPAWLAIWEIVLAQVPAPLQTFVAQGAISSLFFSPEPQESLPKGTMLPCSGAVISEWPLVWGLGSKKNKP